MASTGDTQDRVYMCVSGAPADADGVCIEHGETACVIGLPSPSEEREGAAVDNSTDGAERGYWASR